jgi:hypothetical protein
MEDQIEREHFFFMDEIERKKYIYIYISDNSTWEDYVIIKDKHKAIEYSKNKNGRVEIFHQVEETIYKPLCRYYKNGQYFIMKHS